MKQALRHYPFLVVLLFWSMGCLGQSDSLRRCNEIPFKVYVSEGKSLSFEEIISKKERFKPKDSIHEKTDPSRRYWIQLDVSSGKGELEENTPYYLRFRTFEYGSLYYSKNGQIRSVPIGVFEIDPKSNLRSFPKGFSFTKEQLIDDRYIYILVQRVTYFEDVQRWKFYHCDSLKNTLIEDFFTADDIGRLAPVYTFSGICLVMFILTLGFYLYSKRLEFLWYALFVLFLFCYLCSDVLKLHELIFGGFSKESYTFFLVTQVLINLFYILFVMYYLNSKQVYPKLHLALKGIVIMLSLVVVMDVLFMLSNLFEAHIHLLNIERLLMSLFGLGGMVYLLIRTKDRLAYFVVSGSFLYMLGALGLLFLKQRLYMISGSTLEILIFASGLTYKIQEEHKEKLKFQKDSLENQIRALRTQINPHFLFNSLSAIQHLITGGKKEQAVSYLSKFSTLMRNVLDTSFQSQVLLQEEIDLLRKYLELEQLRFNDSFTFTIELESDLDPWAIEIPALLLQPFVENAIIHGLLPKHGDKQLHLRFKVENGYLICEIEDNGIGREAAARFKKLRPGSTTSRGVEMTQKRLELFNNESGEFLTYIDKYGEKREPSGTLVRIFINIS